jgi:5-methylcytosine-specific restriction enzyme A
MGDVVLMPYLDPANPRTWYSASMIWRRKAKRQLALEPLCAYCLRRGIITPATLADHCEPHGGDWEKFLLTGKLQSLCWPCHSQTKQREERRGYSDEVGDDGWPVDEKHPANRPRKTRFSTKSP